VDVDISMMGYEQWIRFLFDRPIPKDAEQEDPWHFRVNCEVTDQEKLVTHVTRLCQEMPLIGKQYAPNQIDEGMWCLLGSNVQFGTFLMDPAVSLEARKCCIQSMYRVFELYVPTLTVVPTCFDMWWDLICHDGFWPAVRSRLHPVSFADVDPRKALEDAVQVMDKADKLLSGELVNNEEERLAFLAKSANECAAMVSQLTADERGIFETLLETLQQILALPNEICQHCALHGLGHLHHPRGKEIVTAFADTHGRQWTPEQRLWVQQCADCRVM
jgi:hypothetical protein